MKATSPFIALALAAAAALLPGTAPAAIVVNIEQQGSDVVISYTGSWDNWVAQGVVSGPDAGVFRNGLYLWPSGPLDGTSAVGGLTRQSGTWTTTFTSPTSFAGDAFGWNTSTLYAARNYTQGDQFTGSLTFSGTDLATMGFTPGDTGVFSGGGNTATYSVSGGGPAPVPEPGTWAAAALLVSGAAFVRWRRRQSAAKKKALGA